MDKSKSIFQIIAGIVLVALIAFNIVSYFQRPKIGYVRSYDLIDKYHGTIEARSNFEKQRGNITANLDSLKANFDIARNVYFANVDRMSPQQRQQQEEVLTQQHNQLLQYNEAIQQRIKEDDNKMTQEVLNQVNAYVEQFAKREGYTVILGTTTSGSLLYGDEALDVTEVLLEELNKNYQGK